MILDSFFMPSHGVISLALPLDASPNIIIIVSGPYVLLVLSSVQVF